MTSYNEKYNTIFVNIPRTASSSMSRLVSTGGHRPLVQRRDIMYKKGQKELYDNAFKFCFVRNPYDRFTSAMYHIRFFDVNEFLKSPKALDLLCEAHIMLFRPQTDFILDKDDNVLVDFMGRFENIKEDWKKVADRLNIDKPLRHLNKSDKVTGDLSSESRQKLYEFYKKDFEVLEYENML